MFFCFVTKHACDGQTDGRTDRIAIPIPASCGKNTDKCPEKEYSMTIIQFIINQNYRQQN